MILVDTSVWIETFRRKDPLDLTAIIPFDDVVTCLPIVQEVLQGFRDAHAFRVAHRAMFALPIVESPLRREVFEEAVELFRNARRAGYTVRSSTDCLVAACALRNGLPVLHRDRDYAGLARVSQLRERSLP